MALIEPAAPGAPRARYEAVAEALVTAYRSGEPAAMRAVWDYFGHGRSWDGMRRYVRLDLGKPETADDPVEDAITLDEARYLVARAQGFESWERLVAAFAEAASADLAHATRAVALAEWGDDGAVRAGRRSHDWNEILERLRDPRWCGLDAAGQMTDALLERLTGLEHVRVLRLQGSKALSDDGLRHLAGLPNLTQLDLMGCSGLTDAGLEVLARLPRLERVVLSWTAITDEGARQLAACDRLRAVDLFGTACGDGALRALAGKRDLTDLRSGDGVTDAGIDALLDLPGFVRWDGGSDDREVPLDDPPNLLLLRGRAVTDAGLARLASLAGLFALDIDGSAIPVTELGLTALHALPHLGWLAVDARDESMAAIAGLPRLRYLRCQDTTAGDDGFAALSRSASIEHIWGRRCYNLGSRGFIALADMPSLRYLSVSCRNVDDAGLSALPRFPSLRELMPIDVPDDGYRHIGRCEKLESLVLMYCRETGDRATAHLTGLPCLKKYFASYTRITDRTPELLSGMASLEEITFDSCAGLTDAGVAALARLSRLRELRLGGMPHVTAGVAAAFGPDVRVDVSP